LSTKNSVPPYPQNSPWNTAAMISPLRQLQNSIRSQICAFSVGFDFLQSAYGQEDMSLCKKSNQRKNHQILLAKRVLQFPPLYDTMFDIGHTPM